MCKHALGSSAMIRLSPNWGRVPPHRLNHQDELLLLKEISKDPHSGDGIYRGLLISERSL